MGETAAPHDTHIELVTPENIAFHYHVAGPFRRLPAYLIDLFIRAALIAAFAVAIFFIFGYGIGAYSTAVGMLAVAYFFIDWFYMSAFEIFWNGQTPGKKLMQIRVISVDGQPINVGQAVMRNFLRVVDSMPYVGFSGVDFIPMYLVGLGSAAMSPRFQRLGDWVAHTMVVVEEPQRLYGVVRVTEPEVLELARQLPGGYQVSRTMARALSDYVLRRQGFGWSRRAEIAAYLGEPLREKFDLPRNTSHDLLLCALYYRIFLSDRDDEQPMEALIVSDEPRFEPAGRWSR